MANLETLQNVKIDKSVFNKLVPEFYNNGGFVDLIAKSLFAKSDDILKLRDGKEERENEVLKFLFRDKTYRTHYVLGKQISLDIMLVPKGWVDSDSVRLHAFLDTHKTFFYDLIVVLNFPQKDKDTGVIYKNYKRFTLTSDLLKVRGEGKEREMVDSEAVCVTVPNNFYYDVVNGGFINESARIYTISQLRSARTAVRTQTKNALLKFFRSEVFKEALKFVDGKIMDLIDGLLLNGVKSYDIVDAISFLSDSNTDPVRLQNMFTALGELDDMVKSRFVRDISYAINSETLKGFTNGYDFNSIATEYNERTKKTNLIVQWNVRSKDGIIIDVLELWYNPDVTFNDAIVNGDTEHLKLSMRPVNLAYKGEHGDFKELPLPEYTKPSMSDDEKRSVFVNHLTSYIREVARNIY